MESYIMLTINYFRISLAYVFVCNMKNSIILVSNVHNHKIFSYFLTRLLTNKFQ